MNRKKMQQSSAGDMTVSKKRRLPESNIRLRRLILSFLELDENSTRLPGIKDCKTINGKRIQKRVLNDYMSNLYVMLRAAHPDVDISRATFCCH